MTLTASLPMYNLPEMRAVNVGFWEALRALLLETSLHEVPEHLRFERPPVPDRIGLEMLLSQTCGYPLKAIFSGQAVRLGTPCYTAPGCDGPTQCGFFVVPVGSKVKELRDLRRTFLFNHRHSNSGMNLPRRRLVEIAVGHRFFARVIETGSRPGNLDRIARAEADATAVDCVTCDFWCRYRPAAARRVRVLAQTPPSPAIPFVTSVNTPRADCRDPSGCIARESHRGTVRGDALSFAPQ